MIPDVDQALKTLITREAVDPGEVEVVLDAPNKEWAARRNGPTVDVYLYDIREDLRRRERGFLNEYDGDRVTSRYQPPRYFKLSYLIAAWTQQPEDEHRLLASLLLCFLRYDALPPDVLGGSLAAMGLAVPVSIALPPPEDRSFADVWTALGGEFETVAGCRCHRTDRHGTVIPRRTSGAVADHPHRRGSERFGAGRDAASGCQSGRDEKRPHPARNVGTDPQSSTETDRIFIVSAPVDSRGYLLARASLVEERIRTLVTHRRGFDPAPDDPFRGLYLSDAAVDALLADTPAPPQPQLDRRNSLEDHANGAELAGAELRLRSLARTASLSDNDVELLVICLLPDLDSRFERLYGYLNDDVTRRRATIGLALELADLSPLDAGARARLAPGAPLVDNSLVLIEELDRPFLTRGIRVPDRVTASLARR